MAQAWLAAIALNAIGGKMRALDASPDGRSD
jgi:hypothetical protein